MPPLVQYSDFEVDSWDVESRGVRDGAHPTEVFGVDGASSERSYFCNWATRYDTIKWLVGQAATYTTGGGDTLLSRVPPQPHPNPDFANWYVTKVLSITGHKLIDEDSGTGTLPDPVYERAEVKCLLEFVPWTALTDAEVVSSEAERYTVAPGMPFNEITTSTQYVQQAGGFVSYLRTDGTALSEPEPHLRPVTYALGFPFMRERFSYTWERVPYPAFAAGSTLRERVEGKVGQRTYLGSVNKTEFGFYQAGSLQLQGCEAKLMTDPTGLGWCWRIKYIFEFAPDLIHNLYFFDCRKLTDGTPVTPNRSGWYQVGRGPSYQAPGTIVDDTTLFPEREFADLWKVGNP